MTLQIILIGGYILFGYFWIEILAKSLAENYFIDAFPIEETIIEELSIKDIKNQDINKILYSYKVGNETFTDELRVNIKAFETKVGLEKTNIIACYNKYFPQYNYIKNWKLTEYYRLMFISYSFFLGLNIVGDCIINRDHFIRNLIKILIRNIRTSR